MLRRIRKLWFLGIPILVAVVAASIAVPRLISQNLIRKGDLSFYRFDYQGAIAYYTRAIAWSPELVEAYNKRGYIYEKTGHWDQALLDFDRAVELDPRSGAAYTGRGTANFTLGNLEMAIEDYSAAIQLLPDTAVLYYQRAHVYEAAGKKAEALQDYETFLELDTVQDEYIQSNVAERIRALQEDLGR